MNLPPSKSALNSGDPPIRSTDPRSRESSVLTSLTRQSEPAAWPRTAGSSSSLGSITSAQLTPFVAVEERTDRRQDSRRGLPGPRLPDDEDVPAQALRVHAALRQEAPPLGDQDRPPPGGAPSAGVGGGIDRPDLPHQAGGDEGFSVREPAQHRLERLPAPLGARLGNAQAQPLQQLDPAAVGVLRRQDPPQGAPVPGGEPSGGPVGRLIGRPRPHQPAGHPPADDSVRLRQLRADRRRRLGGNGLVLRHEHAGGVEQERGAALGFAPVPSHGGQHRRRAVGLGERRGGEGKTIGPRRRSSSLKQ